MTIEYTLDEKDFLIYQLFSASRSQRIIRKRKRSKVSVPLFYVVTGLLLYFLGSTPVAIFFLITGILWFFIYPLWERRHYIKHYRGFIAENYKDRIGRNVSLEFNNDVITAKDNGSESKVLTTELKEIIEIPSTIFIVLIAGQAFILPKERIKNINSLTSALKELASCLNIRYEVEEHWVWK